MSEDKAPMGIVKELTPEQIKANTRMNAVRKKVDQALKDAHDEMVDEGHGELTVYEVNAVLIESLHAYNRHGLQSEKKAIES